MEFAYCLNGGAPLVRKYITDSAATLNPGVPLQSDAETADNDGIIAATTVVCVGCMGVCLDSDGSTTTAAQTGTGDNAAYVSTIISRDAVWRAKLSGDGSTDTAISVITQAALDTGGTAPNGTVTDEFMVWGYSGANEGIERRADTANSVLIAFPYDIAAGDTFLQTSTVIAEATQWPTLTQAFTQVNAAAAVTAGSDNFTVVEQRLNGISNNGRTNSFTYLISASHAFGTVGAERTAGS